MARPRARLSKAVIPTRHNPWRGVPPFGVMPPAAAPKRTVKHPERHEQKAITGLLASIGAKVYTIGTTRRKGDYQGTMQTPGLPDLIAFLRKPSARDGMVGVVYGDTLTPVRHLLCIEAKRPKGGRFSPEQEVFRDLCRDADVSWVGGSLDDVIAWLITHGYLKADSVPHYRLPKNLQEHA